MKFNQWTLGLAALGVISAASVARADEKASSVATALANTTISGYVDTSAQWNPGSSGAAGAGANAPAYAFGGKSKADGFNLNVVKLSIGKPADAADAWGAGYQVDALLGPDASSFNTVSTGNNADFALRQAYVDLKAPIGTGLDIKVGVWDTIIGYEVFDSASNPNFTRSWAYSIEPTTHTGVLLGYNLTDSIALQAGIADTYGSTINQRAQYTAAFNGDALVNSSPTEKTYLFSAAYTASTNMGWFSGSTIYATLINGFNSAAPSAGNAASDQISWYLGSTINTPMKDLKVGASYDYTDNQKHDTASKGYAWAVDGYALYQVSEKLSLNSRAEYAVLPTLGGLNGVASKVFALTETVQYDLWKNVVSRLEARWDHAADGNYAFGGNSGTTTKAGYTGTARNSWEFIASLVYKF